MISWMKTHKYYLIGTGVILLALLAAFFFGGNGSGASQGEENGVIASTQEQTVNSDKKDTFDRESDTQDKAKNDTQSDVRITEERTSEAAHTEASDTAVASTASETAATAESEATEATSVTETETATENPQVTYNCTIQISCASILNHMDTLKPEKAGLVPADGVLLSARTVSFTEGESVYDVLRRVCKESGVPLDAVYTPAYGTAYIKGISNIYEFDCGSLSGWKYCVNGVYPSCGCSAYTLQDGDVIVWNYSCDINEP